MKIGIGENSFFIVTDNGKTVELSGDTSFVSVGTGSADYKMSRGSFKIRQQTESMKELFISSCDDNDGEITVMLSDREKNRVMRLSIKRHESGTVVFSPEIVDKTRYNRMTVKIPAVPQEKVYGGGENFTEFNLSGQKARVWVAEHINGMQMAKKIIKMSLGINNPDKRQKFSNYETYYAQPTFVSSEKYFVHCDTTDYAQFDFSDDEYHIITVNDICDIYFGFSMDFESLMTSLSALLGRQPELPDWVYDGAVLGIQGGTETVYKKLENAEKHNTAVAGVWCQDWEGRRVTAVGKQLQWNWQWDSELYPELDKEIFRLKETGIRFLGYINPFLAVEKDLYKYASPKGYCVKDREGKDYLVKITTFPAAMIDLTNKEAYEWIKSIIKKNMIDFGLDGWMADFGEYLPTDCVLASGESAEKIHNTWPALWAKVNREALEETDNVGKILFFTRSGYTGTVKNSTMMWAGDQHVDWSVDFGLASVIPAQLSLSVCGFGLSHSDVGGYTTFGKMRRSEELMIRWTQMNAFSPFMRTHEGLNPELNVQFDSDDGIADIFAKYSRIHKALKPYLKKAVGENSKRGIPVIRPLFFYYDEEKAYNEKTQYLLGRDILVAPVVRRGETHRVVYLPQDSWINLWNGEEYGGGMYNIDAPLGEIPVFIRKSSDYKEDFIKLCEI